MIDPIVIPIEGKLSEESIAKVNDRFKELENEAPQFDVIKDLPQTIQPIMNMMLSTIANQRKSISSTIASAFGGKEVGAQVSKTLLESMGFFAANIEDAMSASGAMGKVFKAIPENMKKSFDAELNDMMRTTSGLLQDFTYSSGLGGKSDASMRKYLMKNASFQKAYQSFSDAYSLNEELQSELLSSIVKLSAPNLSRTDYITKARQNAFGQLQKLNVIPEVASYKERLPEQFRSLSEAPRLTSLKQIRQDPKLQGDLSHSEYNIVKKLAAENPSWERALAYAGVATRTVSNELSRNKLGQAGTLMMPGKPISKAEYAIALGHLHKDMFLPALEGAPMYGKSLADTSGYTQQSIANKNSARPAEGYAAFEALKGIGVSPAYLPVPADPKYRYKQKDSVAIKSNLSVRPDMYQIQSLTWDDFQNGVILGSDAPKQNLDDERAAGRSVNKMISRSVYTDLAGMFGHNTFGNGSTTDNSKPRVLQIDLSDRAFKKKDGKFSFGPDGVPEKSDELDRLIADIFTPRATLTSTSGQQYHYPVVDYGKNGRYVPTNVKNGLVWLTEEGAYTAASQRFIDKYGVNAYDNLLAEDLVFEDRKTLNKGLEARNRDLTPSIPFSQLGGRIPDARKIGFADLKYLTGLDGSSLWMPGFIPGEAGTIRSVGLKGTGMSVDYKQMYRQLYGDDAQWWMPFRNAPQAIKELYKEKGLEDVLEAYNNPNLRAKYGLGNSPSNFHDHFFDALTMDAIIDTSMQKTSFYDNMSLPEMQDAFTDIAQMTGGLRMVATAGDFLSHSKSLSRQVAQNLDPSKGDLRENRKKWTEYIDTLRKDPQRTAQLLFGDLSDPTNKLINQNPSLMWNIPKAKQRVLEAIESAEIDRQSNKIFTGDDLVNALALPNIGEIMLQTGRLNGETIADENLARILSLQGNNGEDAVAFAPWRGTKAFSGYRFPNNVTEQYALGKIPAKVWYEPKCHVFKHGNNSKNGRRRRRRGYGSSRAESIERYDAKVATEPRRNDWRLCAKFIAYGF